MPRSADIQDYYFQGGIQNKKLGLVGGMGSESTIPYYHDIVY